MTADCHWNDVFIVYNCPHEYSTQIQPIFLWLFCLSLFLFWFFIFPLMLIDVLCVSAHHFQFEQEKIHFWFNRRHSITMHTLSAQHKKAEKMCLNRISHIVKCNKIQVCNEMRRATAIGPLLPDRNGMEWRNRQMEEYN